MLMFLSTWGFFCKIWTLRDITSVSALLLAEKVVQTDCDDELAEQMKNIETFNCQERGSYIVSLNCLDQQDAAANKDTAVHSYWSTNLFLFCTYPNIWQLNQKICFLLFVFLQADEPAHYTTLAKRELVLRQHAMLGANSPAPAMVSCLELTLQPTASTGTRPATASNPSAQCRRPDCQAIRQRLRTLEASFPERAHTQVHQEKVFTVKILKPS